MSDSLSFLNTLFYRYFFYNFSTNNNKTGNFDNSNYDTVILEAVSNNEACAVVSIQNVSVSNFFFIITKKILLNIL